MMRVEHLKELVERKQGGGTSIEENQSLPAVVSANPMIQKEKRPLVKQNDLLSKKPYI